MQITAAPPHPGFAIIGFKTFNRIGTAAKRRFLKKNFTKSCFSCKPPLPPPLYPSRKHKDEYCRK
jgi:hypothetical protein